MQNNKILEKKCRINDALLVVLFTFYILTGQLVKITGSSSKILVSFSCLHLQFFLLLEFLKSLFKKIIFFSTSWRPLHFFLTFNQRRLYQLHLFSILCRCKCPLLKRCTNSLEMSLKNNFKSYSERPQNKSYMLRRKSSKVLYL